jgi:predicted membrane protein
MENNNPRQNGDPDSRRMLLGIHMGSSNIISGLLLVGIGVLFLLGNLHIVHAGDWVSYWPVIPIVIGLVQLVDSTSSSGRIGGGVMLVVGGLFLADNLGYINFPIWDLWPLILIGVGLMMLWNRAGFVQRHDAINRLAGHRTADGEYKRWNWPDMNAGYFTTSSGCVNEFAVFGGSRRAVVAQDFRGGKVAVIFGGVTLDLTGAGMAEDVAVLHVSALYGGVSIKIPPTWSAEAHGVGIFGGFGDHSIHPPATPGMKRLIVKGAAIFGGVGIKN